jgi:uncharacterized membrane protein
MTWPIPLFFNIVFGTIRSFIDKRLVNKIDPFVAFFYATFWSNIFFFSFYLLRHHSIPIVYPEMLILGALYSFIVGSYMAAIKINLSQTVIFNSYYLVIPLGLAAIFLGEWQLFDPTIFSGQKTLLGIFLAFVSMGLFLSTKSRKEEKIEKKWLMLILFNIIFNGFATYWGKIFITDHGPLETLISQSLGGIPVLFIFNKLRRKSMEISGQNHLLSFIDGFVIFLAVTFYYLAIKNGPLTVVLPIQTLVGTIAIALVGLFLFKEKAQITNKKIWGLILGFIGVVLLIIQ